MKGRRSLRLVMERFGEQLPQIVTPPPGPRSGELQARLERCEAPNLTIPGMAIVWEEAAGSNVRDADGNVYIDLTAAFGVAGVGHRNPRVVAAVQQQAALLLHAMGDVYASDQRVALEERLCALAPMPDARCFLATGGAEAVEIAIKTATLATGRPGVLAFGGGYHGLTLGALAATSRDWFRQPFTAHLSPAVIHLPYPYPYRFAGDEQACLEAALSRVADLLARPAAQPAPIGAVLVEPIQGREGEIVPPAGWLRGLRRLCDEAGILLIADEIFTGFGRTGRLFAVQHEDVIPDLICLGKGMTGGVPLAACVGRAELMAAWSVAGEPLHTATFMGNPLGCAAAQSAIAEIEERGLVARAASLGERLRAALEKLAARHALIGQVRGRGLMIGIELVTDRVTKPPATEAAWQLMAACQRRGVLVLAGGMFGNVLSITPPFVISEAQIDAALEIIDAALEEVERAG